jgi:hypothetical protein
MTFNFHPFERGGLRQSVLDSFPILSLADWPEGLARQGVKPPPAKVAEGWGPIMEPNATPVQGKVCPVTGATNGIGLVAARGLARRGAHVVLVGRSPARCDSAIAQAPAQTGNPQP